jgi:hypothetical protein
MEDKTFKQKSKWRKKLLTEIMEADAKDGLYKQQTAVEFLFEQLWETPKDKLNWYAILKKAKAMEKEQIMSAFISGDLFSADYFDGTNNEGENYYNETYQSRKD